MAFQRKKPAAIGVKAHFPGFIEPALASSVEKVPGGARWIHEIKFDGYRVQLHLANDDIKIFTRKAKLPHECPRPFADSRCRRRWPGSDRRGCAPFVVTRQAAIHHLEAELRAIFSAPSSSVSKAIF